MPGDVFEEHPPGLDFTDDPGNIGPQMALVPGPAARSGLTEGLAGISGKDDVDDPAKGASVKAGDVVPDRGGGEISGALGGDKGGAGVVLPLDKAARVKSGLGQHEAQIKATGSGAKGQSVPGT